ncbi:MAG: sulfotransferase [Kiritimatiellae bacterium]|nr:sulfotransferase [Kiritimatiellia bacterium]
MSHMPDFVLIGAPKAGSTSLYHYLRQHPEIYMPSYKDPRFFAFEGSLPAFGGPSDDTIHNNRIVWEMDTYMALFDGVTNERAVGEASVRYFEEPAAAKNMHRHNPDMKLLLILRNPLERAWSHYCWKKTAGVEPASSFAEALKEEDDGARDTWYWGRYARPGYYAKYYKCFLDYFPQEQFKVHLFEDFKHDPVGICRDYYRFLGVSDAFEPDARRRYNVSGTFSHPVAKRMWEASLAVRDAIRPCLPRRLRHSAFVSLTRLMKKEAFPEEMRSRLMQLYRQDILELQELIGRDLSGWLM